MGGKARTNTAGRQDYGEILRELWQSATTPEFSASDIARVEHALQTDFVPAQTSALRTIARRGRSCRFAQQYSIAEDDPELSKKLLDLALPSLLSESLNVRAAAVAAVACLEPGHGSLKPTDEDTFLLGLAHHATEEEQESTSLDRMLLSVMIQRPSTEWWQSIVNFASHYYPHPGWTELSQAPLELDIAIVDDWLTRLFKITSVPEHLDGLSFHYGYSDDIDPIFELKISGQEFVDYEKIFDGSDYIGGCKPNLLQRIEDIFAMSSEEPIVNAARHMCLASLVKHASEKHCEALLEHKSEVALAIGYGSISFLQIGTLTEDGWAS